MSATVKTGRCLAAALAAFLAETTPVRAEKPQDTGSRERSFLYVAVPGIRNYVEFGGIGLLVFDRDDGYRFVERIPTWPVLSGEQPENVKGIAASAIETRYGASGFGPSMYISDPDGNTVELRFTG